MKLWILLSVAVAVTLADRRRECERNSHWEDCGTSCQLNCRNYNNPPTTCNLRCNAGCQCDVGYVLDEQNLLCIRSEDCSNSNAVSNCKDDVDPGPCWAYVESWYYNTREGRCMKFVYGGCQGNGNRFPTEVECNRKCRGTGGGGGRIPDVRTDICELSAETGNCRASITRYFFNKRSGKCEKFVYGGCGGNANNFDSIQACQANCGGSTKIPDISTDTCDLPAETGNCRASMTRYYFNRRTGRCETFFYGGCGGNSNNFQTLQACQANCGGSGGKIPDTRTGTCDMPAEVGDCKGSFARYYFNRRTGQCEKFVYGGCGGNANNFERLQDCQRSCGSSDVVKVCALPVEIGNCRGSLTRYYFDRITGRCEKFFYGGCGGNENNFQTQLECQKTCATRRS